MFETTVHAGVCRFLRPRTRWLSTGWNGGESRGPAAYNVTVPDGWPETDLAAYVESRRTDAGFDAAGPTLLTGVSQAHARRARLDGVEAVVTAGVSNPAALPVTDGEASDAGSDSATDRPAEHPGTVNVVVGTTRALAPGALANLLTVAAEAKAATLLARTGVPGTTTDAVVAACDPAGPRARFSGSATPVGRAARACVRDALLASLDSRYADGEIPTVADAPYGVVTDTRAVVTRL
ncbi:adenosylcobinamide amidohydrolase [Salinigranum marinum]|uniref:adenosylcobinamide amidohydrolase n=1 Tax=Salinigranum marinum TaxID=1515595 RepID=UPI002989ABE0|nr:adenosylcobinamide amidohydrolase [Salinigranum marinum]